MLLRSIFAVGRNYVAFENKLKTIPSRGDKLSF